MAHHVCRQAEFVSCSSGKLFVVSTSNKQGSTDKVVVFVPPFAEEMNKSRRMVTLLSQALAQQNISTYCFDLYGTGDSQGEFEQASWSLWKADLKEILLRVNSIHPGAAIHLVALRLGGLLVNDCLNTYPLLQQLNLALLCYWNPVFKPQQYINQFLRMRLAADMINAGNSENSLPQIRQSLVEQGTTEVAGYTLSQQLVAEIEAAQCRLPACFDSLPLSFFEVSLSGAHTPALLNSLKQVREEQNNMSNYALQGAPFWRAQEITLCPALIEGTLKLCVDGWSADYA